MSVKNDSETANEHDPQRRAPVLVTGGAGYLGGKLVRRLSQRTDLDLVVTDIRRPAEADRLPGVTYELMDIRDPALAEVIHRHRIGTVVHLAAVVSPGRDRRLEHSVDVGGTRNLLDACLLHDVKRLIVTSSGAAYGYFADNPVWLDEQHPIRADETFSYAWHKRQVEEMLAEARHTSPQLEQIVFRPCTILGRGVDNRITQLFDRPWLVGVRGGDDRFVFVWDEDVARALEVAIDSQITGIFNLAGDGALGMAELAQRMGKTYRPLPASWLRSALWLGQRLRLTDYGPEQVRFLQYRPVLANRRLKEELGFRPAKTSSEVFNLFLEDRGLEDRGLKDRPEPESNPT